MSSTYQRRQDIPTIQLEWSEFSKIMSSVFYGLFLESPQNEQIWRTNRAEYTE